jgi:hypothetical protein
MNYKLRETKKGLVAKGKCRKVSTGGWVPVIRLLQNVSLSVNKSQVNEISEATQISPIRYNENYFLANSIVQGPYWETVEPNYLAGREFHSFITILNKSPLLEHTRTR